MEYFCQNPWLSIKSTVIHWKENNEAWQLWTRGKLEDASLSYKYHHCPSLISKTEKHKSMLVLIYTHKGERESCSVVSDSLWPHGLYNPWNSLGQNTRVSSLSLLQGIFPTQGSNPGLLHCRQILYQLSHKGSLFTFINKQIYSQGLDKGNTRNFFFFWCFFSNLVKWHNILHCNF